MGTGRAINLKLGTHWCIIKLNVPVTELDMSISNKEGQTPANVISPTRQAPGTIQAEEEEIEPDPAGPDMIDLLYDENDALDIFNTPQDRDTSNSHQSSEPCTPDNQIATAMSDSGNDDNNSEVISLPTLKPNPIPLQEKENNTNSWILGSKDPNPPAILPSGSDLAPPDETMAISEVSGFTTLSYQSNETVSWFNDPSIPSHIQGRLMFLEHYDRWMSSVKTLEGVESVAAAVALRNLKKHAEDALKLIFASGCMVRQNDHSLVDPLSYNHAKKYFLGVPLKKFLRALRKTKTKVTELMHHLEALSGDGHPEQGKLAVWTRYRSSPAHPNHTIGLLSPVTILDKDYDYMEACLDIINRRNYKENHPSPRLSSSATKKTACIRIKSFIPSALPAPPIPLKGSKPHNFCHQHSVNGFSSSLERKTRGSQKEN